MWWLEYPALALPFCPENPTFLKRKWSVRYQFLVKINPYVWSYVGIVSALGNSINNTERSRTWGLVCHARLLLRDWVILKWWTDGRYDVGRSTCSYMYSIKTTDTILLIRRHLIAYSKKNRFEGSFVRLRNGGSSSPIIPSEGQGEPIQDQRDENRRNGKLSLPSR